MMVIKWSWNHDHQPEWGRVQVRRSNGPIWLQNRSRPLLFGTGDHDDGDDDDADDDDDRRSFQLTGQSAITLE